MLAAARRQRHGDLVGRVRRRSGRCRAPSPTLRRCRSTGAGGRPLEVLHGSWDLPGARLLDVVATMDRLRSPGGCPWDAEQDHASLAPYLLEEAYEAFQAIEDGDLGALREELGDVLLQVAFHARLAEELPDDERWTIDDVAGGLVDKLIRRHPHVFAGRDGRGADEVNANWEAIKAAERGGRLRAGECAARRAGADPGGDAAAQGCACRCQCW